MSDDLTVTLLGKMIEQNDAILKKLASNDQRLEGHIRDEKAIIAQVLNAFPKKPDGSPDFEGHEVYHSALIEESRDRAKLFRELQNDLIKKGFWGALFVIAALAAYWWNGNVGTIKP